MEVGFSTLTAVLGDSLTPLLRMEFRAISGCKGTNIILNYKNLCKSFVIRLL